MRTSDLIKAIQHLADRTANGDVDKVRLSTAGYDGEIIRLHLTPEGVDLVDDTYLQTLGFVSVRHRYDPGYETYLF